MSTIVVLSEVIVTWSKGAYGMCSNVEALVLVKPGTTATFTGPLEVTCNNTGIDAFATITPLYTKGNDAVYLVNIPNLPPGTSSCVFDVTMNSPTGKLTATAPDYTCTLVSIVNENLRVPRVFNGIQYSHPMFGFDSTLPSPRFTCTTSSSMRCLVSPPAERSQNNQTAMDISYLVSTHPLPAVDGTQYSIAPYDVTLANPDMSAFKVISIIPSMFDYNGPKPDSKYYPPSGYQFKTTLADQPCNIFAMVPLVNVDTSQVQGIYSASTITQGTDTIHSRSCVVYSNPTTTVLLNTNSFTGTSVTVSNYIVGQKYQVTGGTSYTSAMTFVTIPIVNVPITRTGYYYADISFETTANPVIYNSIDGVPPVECVFPYGYFSGKANSYVHRVVTQIGDQQKQVKVSILNPEFEQTYTTNAQTPKLDDIYAITFVVVQYDSKSFSVTLTQSDMVMGSSNSGSFAKEVKLVSAQDPTIYITIVNAVNTISQYQSGDVLAINTNTLVRVPYFQSPFPLVPLSIAFDGCPVDVTTADGPVVMRVKFAGINDPNINLLGLNINYVPYNHDPAQVTAIGKWVSGEYKFEIMVPKAQQAGDILTAGWSIVIDSPTGFINGVFGIRSQLDPQPYYVTVELKDRTSGNEKNGAYNVVFPIQKVAATCSSQDYTLDYVQLFANNSAVSGTNMTINPLATLPIGQDLTIPVSCSASSDTTAPILKLFSISPTVVDVYKASNRFVVITFTTSDDSGISKRHLPIVYIASISSPILQFKSTLVTSNSTTASYSANCTIPYGYGNSASLSVSIYGVLDNYYNLVGFTTDQLKLLIFDPFITRSTDEQLIPYLESHSKIYRQGGQLTVYGNFIGSSTVEIESYLNPNPVAITNIAFIGANLIIFDVPGFALDTPAILKYNIHNNSIYFHYIFNNFDIYNWYTITIYFHYIFNNEYTNGYTNHRASKRLLYLTVLTGKWKMRIKCLLM
eukprot:gene15976-18998_t